MRAALASAREIWRREFLEADLLDYATRLMLIYLMLKVSFEWYVRVPVLFLCAVGLVARQHRSPLLWLLLLVSLTAKLVSGWCVVDNHQYLLTYWTLAIALACWVNDSRPLAFNGRLLIGLCFLFATLWKGVLSDSYMDGAFFHSTFLHDKRFFHFASVLGGIDHDLLVQNQKILAQHMKDPMTGDVVRLHSRDLIVHLATFTTWWTVLIEGAVAAFFLWPGERGLALLRDWLLLVFAWSTYAIAPVAGFGALLMMMGLVQCAPRRQLVRGLYLMSFFVMYAYKYIPWQDWVQGFVDRA